MARVTASDIVGVPFLPSGRMTASATRLRTAVGRLHGAMVPAPVRILEGLFGVLDHRVLVALCELGVPDALTERTTIAVLAARLDADPEMLERLLRFAASRGWVRIDRRGRVRPTAVTAFLRQDHPGGWRAWVDFAGGAEITAAVGALTADRDMTDGFAHANGSAFFEWMADHPERWHTFDRAMAAGGRMHALAVGAALDWSDTRRVCDVGGGNGALLATLLDLHAHLEGAVFDLPDVVGRVVDHPRLVAIAGDAFVHVPDGYDRYLLVNVLHDWGDAEAVSMLGRVRDAAAPAATVVVVDGDRPVVPRADVATSTDVLMAALTPGGRERDAAAFDALGRAAGLRRDASVRLASGDLAHVFTPLPG
jgi:O-methyltransferase domain